MSVQVCVSLSFWSNVCHMLKIARLNWFNHVKCAHWMKYLFITYFERISIEFVVLLDSSVLVFKFANKNTHKHKEKPNETRRGFDEKRKTYVKYAKAFEYDETKHKVKCAAKSCFRWFAHTGLFNTLHIMHIVLLNTLPGWVVYINYIDISNWDDWNYSKQIDMCSVSFWKRQLKQPQELSYQKHHISWSASHRHLYQF